MSPTEVQTLAAIPDTLLAALREACTSVSIRATDRLSAAHDASHYLLTPQAVATPSTIEEVASLLGTATRFGIPLTFRSGGTSLSGQSGGSGVIVDTRKNFRSITVASDGRSVSSGPGATIRQVNTRLTRFRRKLGPDPASEIACTIGGVVANNSSGMACGTTSNTYRTLQSSIIVLPSGSILDTSKADADEELRTQEPRIYQGLLALRERVMANPDSVKALSRLYAIKNTMGYGLNSLLDFQRPIDILEHLIIGSEGTLAFIGEATFRTVPVKGHAATGLLIFPTLAEATSALPRLVESGFATIELLDATSLLVAQRDPEATEELRQLPVEQHAALLVEFQEESEDDLDQRITRSSALLSELPLTVPASLSTDGERRAQLWHIRKGLYTAVAGNRPQGTTALLEDIAVPVHRLRQVCEGLISLFAQYEYADSVIFGHAKDGNIHFMVNERFDDPASLRRYEAFTEDMVALVLSQDGTLKAEHGTGRIMAPFVHRQYGDELYSVMQDIKALIDPAGLLNPGVLITEDPSTHLKHLKTNPPVEEEVDRCVECGYCEPVCPSKDITTTPRERIVLRREMARARAAGDQALLSTLEKEYEYDAIQTCAADGMCQTACPVLINTGDLVRRLRAEDSNRLEQTGWAAAAQQWDLTTQVGGLALTVAKATPSVVPQSITRLARKVVSTDTMPGYSDDLPGGGRRRTVLRTSAPEAIYFSSCTTTMFGPAGGGEGVAASFQALCERAGIKLATPADLPSLCCGTPWKSKGLTQGYDLMKDRVAASLREATHNGLLPIVCDASSCTEGLEILLEAAGTSGLEVIDAVTFVAERVLPKLPQTTKATTLTVHPTCSSTRLGINANLLKVAGAVAEAVIVPDEWGCCAFAGDRGMLHPELTESATRTQAEEITSVGAAEHASLNRTCELGMTRATGKPYRHVLEILHDQVKALEEA